MEENEQKNKEEKDNKNEKTIKIKIMTLGESDVGKSCFIVQYTQNTFQEEYISTIGIEYYQKYLELDNKKYQISFFDTAGQEKFNSIASNSIKRANGILLMYDITKKQSYNRITEWMKSIMEYKDKDFPIIIVGNKSDLEEEREVTEEEGKQLLNMYNDYNLDFKETSVKNNKNVEEAALALINKIIDKQKEKLKANADKVELNKPIKKGKKGKC